jgi:hypothetical protein
MSKLDDFNAELLAKMLGGNLRIRHNKYFGIYIFHWGNIEIHDNGGEANIYFQYLRDVEIQLPAGVRISEFTFTFSIPYMVYSQRIDEAEFATRIKFHLERAATGTDDIDYFRQQELASPKPFTPLLGKEGYPKIKCDMSAYLPADTKWQVFINSDFEFEVWHGETLYRKYRSFKNAVKGFGIKL